MPEYADLCTAFPGTDWNNRAHAYDATIELPAECELQEDTLFRGNVGRCKGEEKLTHEFSHEIHQPGIRFTTPDFDEQRRRHIITR